MRLRSFFETGRGKVGLDILLFSLTLASCFIVSFATERKLIDRLYDIALGVLISIVFYYLVVRIPEFQKRERLKRNLRNRYAIFRRECTQLVIEIADGACDPSESVELSTPAALSRYMLQEIEDGQTRWDAFENNIIQIHLDMIFSNIDLLREEILFLLSSTDISDEKSFKLMKRLSAGLHLARKASIGYDEIRPLARFLHEVLAGWSVVDGYTNKDFISEMIESI